MSCNEEYEIKLLTDRLAKIVEDISKRGYEAYKEHLDEIKWLRGRFGEILMKDVEEDLDKEIETSRQEILKAKSLAEIIVPTARFISLRNIKAYVMPFLKQVAGAALIWPLIMPSLITRRMLEESVFPLIEEVRQEVEETIREEEEISREVEEEIEEELKTRWYRV